MTKFKHARRVFSCSGKTTRYCSSIRICLIKSNVSIGKKGVGHRFFPQIFLLYKPQIGTSFLHFVFTPIVPWTVLSYKGYPLL